MKVQMSSYVLLLCFSYLSSVLIWRRPNVRGARVQYDEVSEVTMEHVNEGWVPVASETGLAIVPIVVPCDT